MLDPAKRALELSNECHDAGETQGGNLFRVVAYWLELAEENKSLIKENSMLKFDNDCLKEACDKMAAEASDTPPAHDDG